MTDERQGDWLFKPVVVTTNGHRQGQDRAEKIVSELAPMIGVPCAQVELAVHDGIEGSLSRHVAPHGWDVVLGSVLLGEVVGGYHATELDAHGRERPVAGRPGHSLDRIFAALETCDVLVGPDAETPAELFARYLVLDAWVANQDRHDSNWAVLVRSTDRTCRRLAPSFDHASSVGHNLTDEGASSISGLDDSRSSRSVAALSVSSTIRLRRSRRSRRWLRSLGER